MGDHLKGCLLGVGLGLFLPLALVGPLEAQPAYRIKDISGGVPGSAPSDFAVVGAAPYFAADNGVSGRELWKSDGTAAGTVLVKDINPGAGDSFPGNLTNVGGTLFFAANDGASGVELWKSDGTTAGTVLVTSRFPRTTTGMA